MNRTRVLLAAMIAATIAGCDNSGSQQSAGDAGSASRDTDTSPKADWGNEGDDNTDGTVDGTSDGVVADGVDATDGSDSSDANDGSDATESSDSSDASDGTFDCSVPPEDCGLYDGQLKICDDVTGPGQSFWVFWNPDECAWNLYYEDWANPKAVAVQGINAHDPGPWMEAYVCKDPPTETAP